MIKSVLNNKITKESKICEFYFCDKKLDYFKEVSILVVDHFDLKDDMLENI